MRAFLAAARGACVTGCVRRPAIRLASLLLACVPVAGCDFFQELESVDEGDEGDDEGDDAGDDDAETGGECTVLDDYCSTQDTLHSCDLESGELVTLSCAELCGNLLNFTCTPTASSAHGCWCVTAGNPIYACGQLEDCIVGCGSDPNSDCTKTCFVRSDPQTIRLLGSLYSCADRACDELCVSDPAGCGNCLESARAGLYGDCGVPRSVCDDDTTDEPSWP